MRENYDFSTAESADRIPALTKRQAGNQGRTRFAVCLDDNILDAFRDLSDTLGQDMQTLINLALHQYLERETIPSACQSLKQIVQNEVGHTTHA